MTDNVDNARTAILARDNYTRQFVRTRPHGVYHITGRAWLGGGETLCGRIGELPMAYPIKDGRTIDVTVRNAEELAGTCAHCLSALKHMALRDPMVKGRWEAAR